MNPFLLMARVVAAASVLIVTACAMFSPEPSLAPRHPEELPMARPTCSKCHEGELWSAMKPYSLFDHTDPFVKDHRFAADREEKVCNVCHARSFCVDCHATKLEVKPALKFGNRADRMLIHRGDYLTRHRLEGKIDPTACYSCHGRANNEKCITCHR